MSKNPTSTASCRQRYTVGWLIVVPILRVVVAAISTENT